MKLLIDENLSYRVASSLQEVFPGSLHVTFAGLERASDREIWAFAKANGYVILTKDEDFQSLLALQGHPPCVIRLLMGNSNNQAVIDALRHNANRLISTLENPDTGLIEIY